jgi:PTH1 family peptidyl-tRNA hydrolase
MRLIVGLGNPGPQYETTRHNVGFMVIDNYAESIRESFKLWGQGKTCELAQATLQNERVLLQKPLTFMNLSGRAVVEAAQFFKLEVKDICVIHDEVDLSLGDMRLKIGGGDGGHNGLKSLTQSLGSPAYSRIRIGIGRSEHESQETADHVLTSFRSNEWSIVEDMINDAIKAIEAFIKGEKAFLLAMNSLNQKKKES